MAWRPWEASTGCCAAFMGACAAVLLVDSCWCLGYDEASQEHEATVQGKPFLGHFQNALLDQSSPSACSS
jgi:hypothetical protein